MSNQLKIMIGVGILTLVLIIGVAWMFSIQSKQEQQKLATNLRGEKIADLGSVHVPRGENHPAYNSNPPTSGYHWGDGEAGAGIHTSEAPDELLVHSLEHGAVIISYQPNISPEILKTLEETFNQSSGKKILVPRSNLDVPVALTSWGKLERFSDLSSDNMASVSADIKSFIETNSDRGPEKGQI